MKSCLMWGGYLGDFSAEINRSYGCKCYCFEPVKEFFDIIENRFSDNDRSFVYQFGLSDHSSIDNMQISKDGSSSIINRGSDTIEEVRMVDIIEFIDTNNIDSISLMKINIEGGEYALLERMIEKQVVKKVKYFQIQFHDIGEQSLARAEKIQRELQKTHSLQWAYRPFIWESWERKQ